MKNQPVLTIAIPIYNGERTIKNMLDILMPQCNEKIEVLVSDNCSTDSTPNIIKEYQNKWGNISYWCNETNLKTDVSSYGMNNSLAQISAEINVVESIITPIDSKDINLNYNILLDSKLINGRVPAYYNGSTISKQSMAVIKKY